MRAAPRISLEVVDVRDIADIHIQAMTSPAAAGERFLATGELMSMREIAAVLRDGLGERAAHAPTREVPDAVVRFAARVPRPVAARRALRPWPPEPEIGRAHV